MSVLFFYIKFVLVMFALFGFLMWIVSLTRNLTALSYVHPDDLERNHRSQYIDVKDMYDKTGMSLWFIIMTSAIYVYLQVRRNEREAERVLRTT